MQPQEGNGIGNTRRIFKEVLKRLVVMMSLISLPPGVPWESEQTLNVQVNPALSPLVLPVNRP